MFRFLGVRDGLYTVTDETGLTSAQCAKPCQVVRIMGIDGFQRVTFNPASIIGAVLTDAINGQMEVYGSTPAAQAVPSAQSAPPTPPPPSPTMTQAPADPFAADRQAERDAGDQTGGGGSSSPQ
jgi:hypothetical protein